MFRSLRILTILGLALSVAACDSSEPEEEVVVNPPTFEIASQRGTFPDGSEAIVFAVTPSDNVSIVRIDITTPLGETVLADLQSSNLLAGQSYTLQEAGTAYPRISGTWRFRFQGSRVPSNVPFDVTTNLSVSARTRN